MRDERRELEATKAAAQAAANATQVGHKMSQNESD